MQADIPEEVLRRVSAELANCPENEGLAFEIHVGPVVVNKNRPSRGWGLKIIRTTPSIKQPVPYAFKKPDVPSMPRHN